jgi:putative ABC transport system substrate-binding protein
MSYGADPAETFTGAATYTDRILKGAKPSELPVQLPTRYYLGLNLTTAKTLGISFPSSLLLTADEVIE